MAEDNNFRQTVGHNINYFRKQNGLTLKDIANKIGVTEATMQRYEAGSIKVSVDKIQDIAKAIGIPASKLTGWEPISETPRIREPLNIRIAKLSNEKRQQVSKYIIMLSENTTQIPYLLSNTEIDLINQYRCLNDEGQETLFDTIDTMLSSGKYQMKSNQNGMVDQTTQAV